MTIDEAISHAREVADKNSGCWKHCTSNKHCDECEQEHEQLADWLEELKAIKDGSIPIIHGKAELELHDKAIRNKAIDDFVNACKEDILCQTFGLHQRGIEEIAKKLKSGGLNE